MLIQRAASSWGGSGTPRRCRHPLSAVGLRAPVRHACLADLERIGSGAPRGLTRFGSDSSPYLAAAFACQSGGNVAAHSAGVTPLSSAARNLSRLEDQSSCEGGGMSSFGTPAAARIFAIGLRSPGCSSRWSHVSSCPGPRKISVPPCCQLLPTRSPLDAPSLPALTICSASRLFETEAGAPSPPLVDSHTCLPERSLGQPRKDRGDKAAVDAARKAHGLVGDAVIIEVELGWIRRRAVVPPEILARLLRGPGADED